VKPGNTWNTPHDTALRVLTQGLRDLKLLDGELDGLIEQEAYKPFYMHKTGHWLGAMCTTPANTSSNRRLAHRCKPA
jgi:Xaa-Pro aminopeptidase